MNEETSGDLYLEALAETEAANQAARDEMDELVSDARNEELAADADLSEVPERDWDDLSADEKLDILGSAVNEIGGRLIEAERNLLLLGQSFVRILQKAGELPEEGSTIEVPTMAIPGKHAKHKTRNSR